MNINKKTDKWATIAAVVMIALLLAVAAFAQDATFHFFGPLSRVITPNGDSGKNNGTAFFCFDNPADSGVSGSIFTLLGASVATLGPAMQRSETWAKACPQGISSSSAQSLTWDGRSNGVVVPSGIYVYRITAEQRSYSGTIIVVR
ncbi:MAG: hypothetical protein ACHQ49_17445 [Elusimicrobiota bacterium]